jgi:HlyD family secretion protein
MSPTTKSDARPAWRKKRWSSAVIIVLLLILLFRGRGGSEDGAGEITFAATRGPMMVSVLEGGSIEALDSEEVKSEVEGQTKILAIVEEGYFITQEDVENGLILVELDSKDLRDRKIEQDLRYENAKASFTTALEQYAIQINQNASDIKAAELKVKFARMDFEKYLGGDVANLIIAALEAAEEERRAAVEAAGAIEAAVDGEAPEEAEGDAQDAAEENDSVALQVAYVPPKSIDFSEYAHTERLGDGEARQSLRKFTDDLDLSKGEVRLAKIRLEGTERLFEQEFVTQNELDNEKLAQQRKKNQEASAQTSLELFIKYEFMKQAEKLLSDYQEALRALERAKKMTVSQLAQAEAKLNSAEAQHNLQKRKRDEMAEQLVKCVIRAPRSGLVVYGEQGRSHYRQEQIEEGSQVRERQVIITIPDPSVMVLKVSVHEASVKQIKVGQKTRVGMDAFPEEILHGEVKKIAVLPDSQSRWMNPDLKVYTTTIVIDGAHDWLKPGLSAQAEIIVEEFDDVLYVPLQAVTETDGERFCYLSKRGGPKEVLVETGSYNESYIIVTAGLDEGDEVLLKAPMKEEETGLSGASNGKKKEKAETKGDAKGDAKEAATEAPKEAGTRRAGGEGRPNRAGGGEGRGKRAGAGRGQS